MTLKRGSAVLFVGTVLVCALALELGYRAYFGAPVLALTNWRSKRLVEQNLTRAVAFDPVIGWVMKGGVVQKKLHTITFGIRKNRNDDSSVRTGGVLVVGDSFSAGSGVENDETWPARVEQITEIPVMNAAVGAWGIDQMVLRSEQLAPKIKPKVIVLGSQDQGVLRVSFSFYGAGKPYFSLEDGQLVAPNQPVARPETVVPRRTSAVKHLLGYSFLIERVAARNFSGSWLLPERTEYVRVDTDPVAVSCALLRRFKAANDAAGIRSIFLLQYGGDQVRAGVESPFGKGVSDCAVAMGVEVVNTFPALKQIAERDLKAFNSLYMYEEGDAQYGHMTPAGNMFIARLVAAQLTAGEAMAAPGSARSRNVGPVGSTGKLDEAQAQ